MPRRIAFYRGRDEADARVAWLVETSPGSGTFAGEGASGPNYGFRIDAEPRERGPDGRRVMQAAFTHWPLSIVDQEYDFLETAAGSGVYRSAASRLPTNDVLDIRVIGSAGGGPRLAVRVGPWEAFAAEAAREGHGVVPPELGGAITLSPVVLPERSPGVFTGEVPVLGIASLRLHHTNEETAELFVSSEQLGFQNLRLKLTGRGGRFRSRSMGPERVVLRPEHITATLTGVEHLVMEGRPLGTPLAPFWAVSRATIRASHQQGD